MVHFLKQIYWFFYKLTPKGKQAYILTQGFSGLQESQKERNKTKLKVISTAHKAFRPKKILAFNKGKSIVKSKKTTHEVLALTANKNRQALAERGLTITKKGKIVNA